MMQGDTKKWRRKACIRCRQRPLLPGKRSMKPSRFTAAQFPSRWYIYAVGKAHTCSARFLRSFPNVAFKTVPMLVWSTMVLSRPLKVDRRLLLFSICQPLSSPGDRWCNVLGFLPAGIVSSSSTLQISDVKLLCPLVCLLCNFPWLRYSDVFRAKRR